MIRPYSKMSSSSRLVSLSHNIIKSNSSFISKSLGKETGPVNVSPSQSDLKYCGILLPAMPASRNKVIYGYWLFPSDLCKTSWIFLHGPVCPKTGSVLSRNVVRFVLERGQFCPETWSVLSMVRFVQVPS